MLIGTCVRAYFKLTQEHVGAAITKSDQMFPYFLSAHLPSGLLGLLLASLTGAALTMLASDLNSLAMVLVEDFYRAARPNSTDRERLRAGRVIVIVVGLLNVVTALILVQTKGSALSMWFAVSAIASGGLAGLFFLAFLKRRASRAGAWAGIASSTVFPIVNMAPFNFPYDDLTIGALGNIILFVTGWCVSLSKPSSESDPTGTFWHWRRQKRAVVESP
jgi:SSS family solute:Na+ symporter